MWSLRSYQVWQGSNKNQIFLLFSDREKESGFFPMIGIKALKSVPHLLFHLLSSSKQLNACDTLQWEPHICENLLPRTFSCHYLVAETSGTEPGSSRFWQDSEQLLCLRSSVTSSTVTSSRPSLSFTPSLTLLVLFHVIVCPLSTTFKREILYYLTPGHVFE